MSSTDHPGHYLTAYVVGNLSAAGRRDVEGHLEGCPDCAAELEALHATHARLAAALADPPPRELDRPRIAAALATSRRPHLRPAWGIGLVAAGLLVVTLVVVQSSGSHMAFDGASSAPEAQATGDEHFGYGEPESASRRPTAMAGEGRRSDGPVLEPDLSTEPMPDPEPAEPDDSAEFPPATSSTPRSRESEKDAERQDRDRASREWSRNLPGDDPVAGILDPSRNPPPEQPSSGAEGLDEGKTKNPELLLGASAALDSSLEPSLRAFHYYHSLDPALSWKAYLSRPLPVPAPEPGDLGLGREVFRDRFGVNPFVDTAVDRQSTFGMDVDTASFTRVRALLRAGRLPEASIVRTEEFVNYFRDELEADPDRVFTVATEGGDSPFGSTGLELLAIRIKARHLRRFERRRAILTLAVDASGSMHRDGNLDLVKASLATLIAQLEPDDRVAIVAYADHATLVLPHTPARDGERLLGALESLSAGGKSHVEAGLELAYRLADEVFDPRALNRVVLATDGVATVGARGPDEILARITVYARRGIYLSAIGFGQNRYDDHLMERLADQGNGRYDYVSDLVDAERCFASNLPSMMDVLARDAKIQVEFDPSVVSHYRLLGYENRDIADDRFRDDTVDAGEVGPGSSVTALYEIQRHPRAHGPLGRVQIRYHDTLVDRVEELQFPIPPGTLTGRHRSDRLELLACAAETAELLRGSYWARDGSLQAVLDRCRTGPGWDELVEVVRLARDLTAQKIANQGTDR